MVRQRIENGELVDVTDEALSGVGS